VKNLDNNLLDTQYSNYCELRNCRAIMLLLPEYLNTFIYYLYRFRIAPVLPVVTAVVSLFVWAICLYLGCWHFTFRYGQYTSQVSSKLNNTLQTSSRQTTVDSQKQTCN